MIQGSTVSVDLPEHRGKSRSEQKCSSSRTQTSMLVAANMRAGGVASMGVRAAAKAAIARVCARRASSAKWPPKSS